MSFRLKRLLSEMAIGHDEDFDFGDLNWVGNKFYNKEQGYIHILDIDDKNLMLFQYPINGKMETLGLSNSKRSKNIYFIFRADDLERELFEILIAIKLEKQERKYKLYKYYGDNIYSVKAVEASKNARGNKLGLTLYQLLMYRYNMILLGDEEQYINAKKMWVRMSEMDNISVDIVNIRTILGGDKDIIRDTKLNGIHDERVWVDSKVYNKIRLEHKNPLYIKAKAIRLIAHLKSAPKNIKILEM